MKYLILTLNLLAFLFSFSTQTLATEFAVNLTEDQSDADNLDVLCDTDSKNVGLQYTLRAAIE